MLVAEDEVLIRRHIVRKLAENCPGFEVVGVDVSDTMLARAGEAVELKPRTVTIDRLELLVRPDADHADFVVGCGKGTYIRSLGRDLAKALAAEGAAVVVNYASSKTGAEAVVEAIHAAKLASQQSVYLAMVEAISGLILSVSGRVWAKKPDWISST